MLSWMLALVLAVAGAALLIIALRPGASGSRAGVLPKRRDDAETAAIRSAGGGADPSGRVAPALQPWHCPVCGEALATGTRIKSSVSPKVSGDRSDRLMHVYGCPYCWPDRGDKPRTCPVCGQRLSPEAYLVARFFEKPGKSHVHVLGCSGCRKA